jgi:hypothetical protein
MMGGRILKYHFLLVVAFIADEAGRTFVRGWISSWRNRPDISLTVNP